MYFRKNGNSEGEGGVHDYGILRAWGGNTFWNFRRERGDKTWKPSVVGYGYFLELPNGSKPALFQLPKGDPFDFNFNTVLWQ